MNVRPDNLPLWCWPFCLFALALVASAQSAAPDTDTSPNFWIQQPTDDWTRHFRVGGLVGLNINARFSTKGQFGVSGRPGPPGVGGQNHFYDDGYVRVDQTGDAQGYTSYWGYDNASQLQGQTLLMHSTKSFSSSGNTQGDDSPYLGFDMAYGDSYWKWHGARIGWEAGLGLLPLNITDSRPLSVSVTRAVYSFNIPAGNSGPIVLPTAPYHGGPSGFGQPTILDVATQLPDEPSTAGTLTGSRTLDVMLYTLRLGPAVQWEFSPRLGMSLGAGPAVGIVSGDYRFDETVVVGGGSARTTGKFSGTDVVFGGYVSAALMYHVEANGDFYLGVQYMPLGNASLGGGGRQAQLNMNGQICLSAGINWPF